MFVIKDMRHLVAVPSIKVGCVKNKNIAYLLCLKIFYLNLSPISNKI